MWQTKVEEAMKYTTMRALILHKETPLDVAIEKFVTGDETRAIFLVDGSGRLVGVINNHSLLQWARLRFGESAGVKNLSLSHVRRMVMADVIADLALPGSEDATVSVDDTLAEAVDKMSQYNLLDIPVIDRDGRIVDDLRLSEILSFAMKHDRTTAETA